MAMIELPEHKLVLSLSGFREVIVESPKQLLLTLRKALGSIPLQILDATFIAGTNHALFATLNALNAFKHGNNLSSHIEVEVLLYLSAQRQISKAIELIGVKTHTHRIVVIFLASNREEAQQQEYILQQSLSGQRDDSIINIDEDKYSHLIQAFNISPLQIQATTKHGLEALEALIIEKSAMLAVSK
ncbi:MAG: KEOPS complex subunit Cgi121 [Candidatus Bathyarchaeota archaeon]|jgi:KEOPS complex subunit Cgi121|nr:KEOPS complex subunit Cgi121 [Candidatus Bathyarchaeota archaeon]